VARGETLSEIADRHGISVSRLMQLNGLGQADHIEAGQKLVVPSTDGASPSSGYNRRASEHVVRSGESLSVIADGYGVPLKQLIAINRISDPDHVESGTRLRLKPAATPRPAPAKAAAKPAPPTARPAATAAKPPVARPVAKPQPTAAKPEPKPAPATTVARQAPAAANPVVARATPVQAPIRKPAAVAAAPRPATTATPSKPDWRNYGPLQVDWANWQPMGGSMVAPTLNAQGESLYLAVNCSARKLNATSQAGQWKSWDDPQSDFEQQLVSDLCKARGS
jgi:LysM repeat protein